VPSGIENCKKIAAVTTTKSRKEAKMITLIGRNRVGIQKQTIEMPTYQNIRITVPCREALENAGATVVPQADETYSVKLGELIPPGLVAVHARVPHQNGGWLQILSLRMEIEPEFPLECLGDPWRILDFTPCPKCGAPLVWYYETGFVRKFRVCIKKPHHHWEAKMPSKK
jgi:hypothetical protein